MGFGSRIPSAIAVCVLAGAASAQDAGDFFKGKVLSLMLGTDPGGAFDAYGHLLAEYMPRYIPGSPRIVMKYTGGQSGGVQLAEAMETTIAPDGLTMAMTTQSVVIHQMVHPEFAKYDARKWIWLGNMAPQRSIFALWHTARARTIDEARKQEIFIGATAPSSPTYMVPDIMNKFLATKFKIVTGYKNVNDINLAMTRGEVEGRVSSWLNVKLTMRDDLAQGRVIPFAISALTRQPEIPDVPTVADLMTDPFHKQVADFISADSDFGRTVFVPPKTPADRAQLLRKAFESALKDEKLLADAAKGNVPIEFVSGDELAKITLRVTGAPKEVVDYAK